MNKYLFVVVETFDDGLGAFIVEEGHFQRTGFLSDCHISENCGGSMPDILGWDEEMESFFQPWDRTMIMSEAHDNLVNKGFIFDEKLATLVDNGDSTVYRPGGGNANVSTY